MFASLQKIKCPIVCTKVIASLSPKNLISGNKQWVFGGKMEENHPAT